MIPLRAQTRGPHRVVVVWVILALCVAALARLATLPEDRALEILTALAVVPARLLAAPLSSQLLTLLTSCFLHAGWVHLASNMLFLAVFGPPVESRAGWAGFLVLYLVSGVAGAIAFALLNPISTVPLVGASGAIAGVLGAHLVLDPRGRITTLVPAFISIEIASLPAVFVIALWFATQIVSHLASVAPSASTQGVAWSAHIAGFVAGGLMATPLVARQLLSARTRKHATGGGRRARRL